VFLQVVGEVVVGSRVGRERRRRSSAPPWSDVACPWAARSAHNSIHAGFGLPELRHAAIGAKAVALETRPSRSEEVRLTSP